MKTQAHQNVRGMKFEDNLLGHYTNKRQAQSYPTDWAYIHVLFEKLPNGKIESWSWHDYLGKKQAYRRSIHKLIYEDDHVILRTFNRESEVKCCDLIFRYNDGWWESDISRCEIPEKNISLETYIKFNGTEYFSRDAAYSIETNEFLWGKKKEQGEFHFFKHDK